MFATTGDPDAIQRHHDGLLAIPAGPRKQDDTHLLCRNVTCFLIDGLVREGRNYAKLRAAHCVQCIKRRQYLATGSLSSFEPV